MKTTHQLARELRRGRDLPVFHFDPSLAGLDDENDESLTTPEVQVQTKGNGVKQTFCLIVGTQTEPDQEAKDLDAMRDELRELRKAAELAEVALRDASRDIHESLQVAIYNLRGEGRDGFKYGAPPSPPLLVHERGIARSEAVEKLCDNAWLAVRKALNRE